MSDDLVSVPDQPINGATRASVDVARSEAIASEPRGWTVTDLLAAVAGLSFVLGTIPDELRDWFSIDAWDIARFPDGSARIWLLFALGLWGVYAVGIATSMAIGCRLVHYRRMPSPGEWLVVTLLFALPLPSVWWLRDRLMIWLLVDTGLTSRFELGILDGPSGAPTWKLVLAGAGVVVVGLMLLPRWRRAPPVCKTVFLITLLMVFTALPGRYGWPLMASVNFVPVWNDVPWQEFDVTTVDATVHGLTVLPVALAAAFAARGWFAGSKSRRRWTNWIGPVMLVAVIVLYCVLGCYDRMGFADSPLLVLMVAVSLLLSWPVAWCWRNFWA
jgi:hypothetical protein